MSVKFYFSLFVIAYIFYHLSFYLVGFLYHLRAKLLQTTETELRAIARAAILGGRAT